MGGHFGAEAHNLHVTVTKMLTPPGLRDIFSFFIH